MPPHPMRRSILPLALLAAACSSLSSEDEQRLADFQARALLYYDRNHLVQAIDQIDRGLELEPEDYKLTSLKASVMLQLSGTSTSTDHQKLDEATRLLEQVYAQRSSSRHEPHLLLSYGMALQKQGRRHLGETIRLAGQASRAKPDEKDSLVDKAEQERELARQLLTQASEMFDALIERGEALRIAHNHRMQVARDLGDTPRFTSEAEAYFVQAKAAQDITQRRIEQTGDAAVEQEQLQLLQRLREEEMEVRGLLGQFYYEQKQFQAALDQLDRVLELDPKRFADYYNRGRVLLELGRLDDAKADFRRFLADPTLPASSEKVTFAVRTLQK